MATTDVVEDWFPLEDLAKSLGTNHNHPNPLLLNDWLTIGDNLADNVLNSYPNASPPDDIVGDLLANGPTSEAAKLFWDSVNQVPEWVDHELLELGQLTFWRHAPAIQIILLFGTLAGGFSNPRINRVLIRTGYLANPTKIYRRLLETAQMVNEVMLPGSLKPGSSGWESILRVRFLHSAVRLRQARATANKSKSSKLLSHELAINQTDQIGTILGFQCTVITGLTYFGIHLTVKEREAYTHLWRLVGYYMGVDDECNPCNQGFETSTAILRDYLRLYFRPDDDGSRLSNGVLKAVSERPPSNIPIEYSAAMSRVLISKKLADALKIPQTSFGWTLLARFSFFSIRLFNAYAYLPGRGDRYVQARRERFPMMLKREIGRTMFSLKVAAENQGDDETVCVELVQSKRSAAVYFGGGVVWIVRGMFVRWVDSVVSLFYSVKKST
ncbi:hypothetical protein SmJEL517_g04702 [Synchytrium microbalum]|uniref:ER-bound oxygenase mpaB/mpaB'/Rubber oxygenase catalytic domain-containing protein n=1 Tax=Synchytrium microbalum TaxID=1806994 RepID=A0A507BYE1_9FUNG|nr:uncharacterized protein SmJEL517_g04702 [Synchytrium microbalum]TPX32131.1 hypothetical protein SmJEL517_g04702 [Synchytrium microbalum]